MTTLPITIESDLLPIETFSKLSELSAELHHAYSVRQIFRTDTEARVSVLDDLHYPTKASKYWQALREQTAMLEQLAVLSFEYRRNEVKIKRHTKEIETSTDEFDREEAQINLDECLFNRASMRTIAQDRAREILMWSGLKAEHADGSFDLNDVNSHQLVSYTVRFAMLAATSQNLTHDERVNLLGQLQTSVQRCTQLGVIDYVRQALPTNAQEFLKLT